MRRLSLLTLAGTLGLTTLVVGFGVPASSARFTDQETTFGSTASSAACFVNDAAAPTVSASIVSKTTPYLGGFIKQGAAYYVYANITGAATRVTADVRPLTSGQYLAPLTAGAYTLGGVAYNYRTASLTAGSPLAGPYTYSVSAANAALQCRTASSTVTVDNTGPTGTDVQPIQGGGQTGRPATADLITFTYSEAIDPQSVLAGWTGASTSVVARITNTGTNDTLTVWNAANTVQLPLGSVALGADYVTANSTWGASGTASTMVRSGSAITVTFGTEAGTIVRVNANILAVWTPSAAVTDAAGNTLTVTTVNEGGAADLNF